MDMIVIGASAGGLSPLKEIVRALPVGFPASVFVVVHMSPSSPGMLVDVLNASGTLPVEWATDGCVHQPRRIYVALADRHLGD